MASSSSPSASASASASESASASSGWAVTAVVVVGSAFVAWVLRRRALRLAAAAAAAATAVPLPQLEATSEDGTVVRGYEDGATDAAVAFLIVTPGMDDGTGYAAVAATLATSFKSRVVRTQRRRYRMDLPDQVTVAQEVADVLALAAAMGRRQPIILAGHSSGGVIALEAMVAAAPGTFAALAVYEPPITTTADPWQAAAVARTVAALDAGDPGRAIQIFAREILELPWTQALLFRVAAWWSSKLRAVIRRQIGDGLEIDRLGPRLDAYAAIDVPVLILVGGRSPKFILDKASELKQRLKWPARLTMDTESHFAQRTNPGTLAASLGIFAEHFVSNTVTN